MIVESRNSRQSATPGHAADRPRIGLALAGGGPMGVIYEIGALLALDEALEGIDFNDLHAYVGVSAGSVNAAFLANGFTPAQLCEITVFHSNDGFSINPAHFFRPAWRLYARCLRSVPRLYLEAVWGFARNPCDSTLLGALSTLARALPPGIWDNESIHRFLSRAFEQPGHTNDFRQLNSSLFVVVANLDSGEIVRFGAEGNDHVPISRAVQASTAVPGLYPPVKIDGQYYLDGGIRKTLHASTALDAGAELLICINPIVSFCPSLADPDQIGMVTSLFEGGFPMVVSQAVRTLIHSRMQLGMAQYAVHYPDRHVVLFEPDRGDARIFFSNIFSFSKRRMVCEHAYQSTRADLRARKKELEPLFAQYGIRFRRAILEQPRRRVSDCLRESLLRFEFAESDSECAKELIDAFDQAT